MENILLKSFKLNQINDNEMRKFECWGSVEVLDRAQEIIPAEEVYKIMDIWMDRGAPIQFMHTNRNVGKGLNWQKAEKGGKKGVLITGMIYKHYAEDDAVWKGLKGGEFEGLSIGGKAFKREKTENGTYLRDLIGYEFSLVDKTGNQEATFTEVNVMAKSKEIKKEEPVMDETNDTGSEDELSQLKNVVTALIEKVSALEEKISGAPDDDAPAEETKADEDSEEKPEDKDKEVDKSEGEDEKTEDVDKSEDDSDETEDNPEVTKLKGQVSKVEKELADMKKSIVTKVIKSKRPAEVKKEDKMTEVRKNLKEMSAKGKIDFVALGKQIRG